MAFAVSCNAHEECLLFRSPREIYSTLDLLLVAKPLRSITSWPQFVLGIGCGLVGLCVVSETAWALFRKAANSGSAGAAEIVERSMIYTWM